MATTDKHAPVSVIVPCYNVASTLDQALRSARNQTHENIEIICVNDGSTDVETLALMQAHAAADDRVQVIDKQNEGYGASMNRGIEAAHGDWIAILEPDDWIEPGMFADMLAFAAGFDETIDLIKTPYWRISLEDPNRPAKLACPYKYLVKQSKHPVTLHDILPAFRNHPSIWSAIYRKGFLDECGIRFLPIPGAGWSDNPFFAETMCHAKNILYYDTAYYCYREDTAEKAKAFHTKNPMIPFERWNQMLDIIERTHMDTPDVLSAHYNRAFMYMSGVIEHVPMESDPQVRAAVEHMFSRMRPEIVDANKRVSPGCRRLYAEVRGLPEPKISYAQYANNLVSQTLHNIHTVGLGQTLGSVKRYLRDYKGRTGGR